QVTPVGGRDLKVLGSQLSFGDTITENGIELQELTVPIPANAPISIANITVTRPMQVPSGGEFSRQEFTSNPVQLLPAGRFAIVADGADDAVSVIDLTNRVQDAFVNKLQPTEVARIPLGVG